MESFGRAELLAALRRVRLVGFDGQRAYEHATLELVPAVPTEDLAPAQRYVLRPNLERVLALRDAVLAHSDGAVDVFALDGGLWVTTAERPDARIPVIPPVVEHAREPDGGEVVLVGDGVHRVYAARRLGLPISVVRVEGSSHPYYAEPEPGGWASLELLDALPDGYAKKAYRVPADHRALYRDFDAVFPGLQERRGD